MTEGVIIQIITTAGLVVVALIGNVKLNRIGADAKEARNQTANSHGTNLRDDIDTLKDGQDVMHADIRGIRKDINGLRRDDGEIRKSIALAADERRTQIAALRDSIEPAIQLALVDHVKSCPLRNPKEKK